MIVTMLALDAWWPPTFSPVGLGRTRLAWSTIAVASHSTRCSTSRSARSCSVLPPTRGATRLIAVLLLVRGAASSASLVAPGLPGHPVPVARWPPRASRRRPHAQATVERSQRAQPQVDPGRRRGRGVPEDSGARRSRAPAGERGPRPEVDLGGGRRPRQLGRRRSPRVLPPRTTPVPTSEHVTLDTTVGAGERCG